MTKNYQEFEALRIFQSKYLGQDYDLNGEDIPSILRNHFKDQYSASRELCADAQRMIDSSMTEEEINLLFIEKWGWPIEPDLENGEEWRDILGQIVLTLKEIHSDNLNMLE